MIVFLYGTGYWLKETKACGGELFSYLGRIINSQNIFTSYLTLTAVTGNSADCGPWEFKFPMEVLVLLLLHWLFWMDSNNWVTVDQTKRVAALKKPLVINPDHRDICRDKKSTRGCTRKLVFCAIKRTLLSISDWVV